MAHFAELAEMRYDREIETPYPPLDQGGLSHADYS